MQQHVEQTLITWWGHLRILAFTLFFWYSVTLRPTPESKKYPKPSNFCLLYLSSKQTLKSFLLYFWPDSNSSWRFEWGLGKYLKENIAINISCLPIYLTISGFLENDLGVTAKHYCFLISFMGYVTFPGLESLLLEAKLLKSTAATLRIEDHNVSEFRKKTNSSTTAQGDKERQVLCAGWISANLWWSLGPCSGP